MIDQPTLAVFERHLMRVPDSAEWSGAPVLLLAACDPGYVSHVIALARSLDAFAPGHHFLVHLVNPDGDSIARLGDARESMTSLRLHVSTERVHLPPSGEKTAYYASARFLRMAELLREPNAIPILALDADAIAVGPLTLDFSDKKEADVCLRRRDLTNEEVEEHLRVAAGAVWARPSESGRAFFDAVAEDLTAAFVDGTAAWFIDQRVLARHVAAGTGSAHVRNLKTKFADWAMKDDAVFWMGKGDRKYSDVRYVLLREAFDEDPSRREAARALHARFEALVPVDRQGQIGKHAQRAFARHRKPVAGIFMPRLDLPWKKAGMRASGGPPILSEDTIDLRLWWKRFAMELARMLTHHGVEPKLLEIPAWEITPERVDAEALDLAFVPHRCNLDFGPTRTPRRFYMQEYFRHVFVVDSEGWSAASSVYPVKVADLPPAVLDAWGHYRDAFLAEALDSKFGQAVRRPRALLEAQGELPAGRYVFFPLQVPHDLSIAYFSHTPLGEALDAVVGLANAEGITVVLKEHPANRASMRDYRQRFGGANVLWSDAHVHDLLRYATGVVTINSGVGFEALLAGVPVICLGRCEYDAAVWQAGPDKLREVWRLAVSEPESVRLTRYARFVDWFLGRHAVDLSRPHTGRHVLDRHVRSALDAALPLRELP